MCFKCKRVSLTKVYTLYSGGLYINFKMKYILWSINSDYNYNQQIFSYMKFKVKTNRAIYIGWYLFEILFK